MKKLFLHITITYLAPISLVVLSCIFTTTRHPQLPSQALAAAYTPELEAYSWVAHTAATQGFVLGSSTMRYGVSCAILSNGQDAYINFAMDARDPVVSYMLLQRYWPLKKPHRVIVGLDPWMYSKKYYKYRSRIMYLDFTGPEAWKYRKEDANVILSKAREYLKLQMGIGTSSEDTVSDSIPEDMGSVKLMREPVNFKEVNEDGFELGKYGWSQIQFQHLRLIREYCDKRGVEVIFVITPKRKDYVSHMASHFAAEHRAWWGLINTHIGGAKCINAMGALLAANQDSVFAEAYHLNQAGQVIFSHYLVRALHSPGIVSPGVSLFATLR